MDRFNIMIDETLYMKGNLRGYKLKNGPPKLIFETVNVEKQTIEQLYIKKLISQEMSLRKKIPEIRNPARRMFVETFDEKHPKTCSVTIRWKKRSTWSL
jgi:hypothetical protein